MAATEEKKQPRRIGQVVYLRPECLEEYKNCHAEVWPEVLEQIKDSNIKDYSIFLVDYPRPTLFASFKWVGEDWDSDMARMAANPKVQEWWKMTDGMQESLNKEQGATGSTGKVPWWREGNEVFYYDP
ncbi:L-rhamnose 1-epimerase-like protein [Dendryphion nanum]|uniref:L-rhamnose 1-epimerase-like protein n=1 Tax=Dendryphion nanum TaxID=256645 RepID=A0A9P9J1J6_9PLEO|nr:L-rhamnose 1-epimerase-like protein [Dendryphion nanum]